MRHIHSHSFQVSSSDKEEAKEKQHGELDGHH